MEIATQIISVIACGLLLVLVFLLVRRLRLGAGHTVFDCVLRAPGLQRPRWRPGLARYQGDRIQWFALWSFRWGPALDMPRRAILDISVAQPDAAHDSVLLNDEVKLVKMTASRAGEPVAIEMLLAASSSLGLMSWIEAGPRDLQRR